MNRFLPLVALAALLALAGCGERTAHGPGGGATGTVGERIEPMLYEAKVTGARRGGAANRLVVTLDVPSGQPGCALEPASTVESNKTTASDLLK